MVADGTMAAEVSTHEMLAQWPYLADLSLINSIVSLFNMGSGQQDSQAVQELPKARPWFYFNFLYKKVCCQAVGFLQPCQLS
jgi:hypothetical protein